MLVETQDLWNNFLVNIKNEISSVSYSAWFNDLKLISIEENSLVVQVPMEIHKKILGDTYYSLIEETLFKLTGINYDITFLLEEEIEPKPEEIEESSLKVEEEEKKEEIWVSNLKPELNFDTFIVGETNQLAKVGGMAVAEAPGKLYNPLFIYGKSGIGKTHLMQAIGNFIATHTDKKVLYTTCDMFMNDYIGIVGKEKGKESIDYSNNFRNKYRNVDVLIIDDIQFLVGAEKSQEEFFHTFQALHQANKQIIISSDKSPNDLKKIEERLKSRFLLGLSVNIDPPEFDLRCRILKQKLKGMSIENMVEDEVIEFIANNCQNDVRFLEGTLRRLMAYTAMVVPEKIDLAFANEALKDYLNVNIYSENTIENIQQVVADYYHITVEDLKGKKRSNAIAIPRQIGMYLSRMLTEETFPRIGFEFGGKDHSTVIHAYEKINKDLKTNKKLQQEINEIKNKL